MTLADDPQTLFAVVQEGEGKIKGQEQLSPEALLKAARRVDWRFLLPTPELGKVAFLGPKKGTLLEALRLFSMSTAVIEEGNNPHMAHYQVVVLQDPEIETLRAASKLVEPGGSLYGEVVAWPNSLKYLRSVSHWLRQKRQGLGFALTFKIQLEKMGFETVQVYWHWPDFDNCTRVIPLYDPDTVRYALNQGGSGKRARLEKALGLWMLDSGLLPWVVPYFSLVAKKSLA